MYVGDCFKKWLIIKPSKPLLFSIICPKYFGRLDYFHYLCSKQNNTLYDETDQRRIQRETGTAVCTVYLAKTIIPDKENMQKIDALIKPIFEQIIANYWCPIKKNQRPVLRLLGTVSCIGTKQKKASWINVPGRLVFFSLCVVMWRLTLHGLRISSDVDQSHHLCS